MERGAWTDDRLDDGFEHIDTRFNRLEARFDRLEHRVDAGFDRLDGRIDAVQVTVARIGGGIIIGLVGVIAAVLARG